MLRSGRMTQQVEVTPTLSYDSQDSLQGLRARPFKVVRPAISHRDVVGPEPSSDLAGRAPLHHAVTSLRFSDVEESGYSALDMFDEVVWSPAHHLMRWERLIRPPVALSHPALSRGGAGTRLNDPASLPGFPRGTLGSGDARSNSVWTVPIEMSAWRLLASVQPIGSCITTTMTLEIRH